MKLVFTSSCKCVWRGCISQREAALCPAKSSIIKSSTLIAHIKHISLTKKPSHAVLYPGNMQTSVAKPWTSSILLHTHYIYYIGDSNRFQLCGAESLTLLQKINVAHRCKRIKHTCSKRRQPRYEHVCDMCTLDVAQRGRCINLRPENPVRQVNRQSRSPTFIISVPEKLSTWRYDLSPKNQHSTETCCGLKHFACRCWIVALSWNEQHMVWRASEPWLHYWVNDWFPTLVLHVRW